MEDPNAPKLLKHLAEFREVLKDYHPSEDSIQTLRKTRTAFLDGTTAAGRNTLIQELKKTGDYYHLISNTTRQQRYNNGVLEKDGESYWHISEEEFLQGLRKGQFLEAAIIHNQQVSGINIKELQKAFANNKIATTDIEVDGGKHIHLYSPQTRLFFILPPAFEEWLKRIRGRGGMTEAEVRRRLESAPKEITTALQSDYYEFIVSGNLLANAETIHAIASGKLDHAPNQDEARSHAEQLVIDVQLYLNA